MILETLSAGLAFVAATVAVTLAAYFLARRVLGGEVATPTKDLAGSVIFRVSALHGLILALVFAQEMIDYQQLEYEAAVEANALADVYFDAARYGGPATRRVQEPLHAYLQLALTEEWDHLGRTGRLSPQGWAHWDEAYQQVLDLPAADRRQTDLRAHMLEQIHTISAMRVKRENHGADSLSGMFWFAAVSGVVLIALAYYPYPPARANMLLLSVFGGFTGVVLFFIYSFSNPYSPPGAIEPAAHARLMEQITRARAAAGG